eukprot:6003389-Pyramimonas_sp.AAC.2
METREIDEWAYSPGQLLRIAVVLAVPQVLQSKRPQGSQVSEPLSYREVFESKFAETTKSVAIKINRETREVTDVF